MPRKLGPADVARIADLARLELAPDEVETMTRELASIVDFAAAVQRIDTSMVPSSAQPTSREAVRDDQPQPGLTPIEAMSGAPDAARDASFFRVPKVR